MANKAWWRIGLCMAAFVLAGCPSPDHGSGDTDSECDNLKQAINDLELESEITEFRVPLEWDHHASDCVEKYRILRAPTKIEAPDETAKEVYATFSTSFTDVVSDKGVYTYFIVGLTAEDVTTPASEALTIKMHEDGTGEVIASSGSSNSTEARLYGTYAYQYMPENEFQNIEEEILTFYEDDDGIPMVAMHLGYAGLGNDYYPGGRCVDTYYGFDSLSFSATADTLTMEFDGEEIEFSYSLNGDVLELDGTELSRLSTDVENLRGCFAMYLDVMVDYPSDATAHFTVYSDTSYDVVEDNTDSLATIIMDYGDGENDSVTADNSETYEFTHSIDPNNMPVYFTAIAATAGGLYVQAYGEYSAMCSADSYEPDNTYGSATTLAADAAPIALTLNDNADWFAADLSAGVAYRFRTNPTYVDTVMYLYDTDGVTELDFVDDAYEYAAAINLTPANTGRYYIKVMPYNGPTCETYTMVLTTP